MHIMMMLIKLKDDYYAGTVAYTIDSWLIYV